MPTLTATADNAKSQVRLDLDFSDIDAPYAIVKRVDPVTGATTTVRGHGSSVTASGVAYAPLQAGYKGVLYDTEAPLDSAFYYTATAPVATLNVDPTQGYTDPWYPGRNTIIIRATANTSGTSYMTFYADGSASPYIRGEDIPVTPGAVITATMVVSTSASNGMTLGIDFLDNTGAILGGGGSSSATVLAATTIVCTATVPASTVAARPYIQMQGTPAASLVANVSSIVVSNQAGSATSGPVTVPSLGSCQLKDPLRPGNNVRVDFAFDPNPQCIPAEGVFFQSLDAEQKAANSAVFNVNNQAAPVVVAKERSTPTSTLTLVSRTFADKARLDTLIQPGSPLLFQVPDEYGVPDQFLSVAASTVSRVLPDHRFPIRVVSLPYSAVASPGGPMQGTVGARWADVCKTWAAVNAAGLTWQQVLDGLAA